MSFVLFSFMKQYWRKKEIPSFRAETSNLDSKYRRCLYCDKTVCNMVWDPIRAPLPKRFYRLVFQYGFRLSFPVSQENIEVISKGSYYCSDRYVTSKVKYIRLRNLFQILIPVQIITPCSTIRNKTPTKINQSKD